MAVGEIGVGACGGKAVEGVFVLTVVVVVRPSTSGRFLWTGQGVNIDVRQEHYGGELLSMVIARVLNEHPPTSQMG